MIPLEERRKEIHAEFNTKVPTLLKQGKNDEVVRILEQSLMVHEQYFSRKSFGLETALESISYNHGFSYLYVTLSPLSEVLPRQLGMDVTIVLYDAWLDPDRDSEVLTKIELEQFAIALTKSEHPLLRVIAYWVLQDYENFELEAMAGAEAGDKRMYKMALVAACALATDKKAALKIVSPILDQGIGLETPHKHRNLTHEIIRSYLEGAIPRSEVHGSFMYPRKVDSKF